MKKSFILFIAVTALTGCSGWPDGQRPASTGFDQSQNSYHIPNMPYEYDHSPSNSDAFDSSQTTMNNEALYYEDKAWRAKNIRDRDTNFSKYLLAKKHQEQPD
ncbi:lipoprotein [Zymomonas sp.]|uniref:lipoprotein n=1 Tax=Zymomonas sp. TaxID=2068624 RepID=UPI0025EDE080|nr:lipoprotein [Zymomonas sp.]MCA1955810.1 membrane lipoprotein lipid attachment site-containing protein [Zymomonas sp.]